jgi:hypothetical protein
VTRARLEVRGDAECLSRSDLASRVASRSPRIQFVDDAAISAQVSLTSARPGNVVAELVLGTVGAEQPPRRFVARSCAEAADAIAVIIAVTLDPTLKRRPATSRERDQNAVPVPEPAPSGNPESPKAAAPADRPAVAKQPAPPPAVESPAPPARSPSAAMRRQLGAYVAGQTIFGPAPSVMPGLALYGMAGLDRAGPWAPALFVGATHSWRSNLSERGGTASFALDAGTLDACPMRLRWAWLDVRPCASALVGRMAASGADIDQPASSSRPFAAAGVALNAGFGATVALYLRLGVGVTLTRDSYELANAVFHRAGLITTSISLGGGIGF